MDAQIALKIRTRRYRGTAAFPLGFLCSRSLVDTEHTDTEQEKEYVLMNTVSCNCTVAGSDLSRGHTVICYVFIMTYDTQYIKNVF